MTPRFALAAVLACVAIVVPRAADAQPADDRIEVEPVTCWWRTSATAVRVGEPFHVLLTCSLLDTEAARAVADESRLDPSVAQLQPFEVVGGGRAPDLKTAGRRFVQFEYRLRAIAENVFASVVSLPALEITYRVESRVAEGQSLAGRDLTYAMPPLAMRVLSLVPDTADDIREAPVSTFAHIEGLESRARLFRVGGAAVFAGGLVLVALVIGRAVRRRPTEAAPQRTLVPAVVLGGVRRELTAVQDLARGAGWSADLVSRALAAIRVVIAYATGRPVSQRRGSTVAGSAAPGEVVVNGDSRGDATAWSTLASTDDSELRDALALLTAAQYGRNDGARAQDARLDEAVDAAIRRADRLIANRPVMERLWPRWRR